MVSLLTPVNRDRYAIVTPLSFMTFYPKSVLGYLQVAD